MQSLTNDSFRFCLVCGFENPQDYTHCLGCRSENPSPVQQYVSELLFTPVVVTKRKSRVTYIILGLFFGYIGIHNFYAKRNNVGAVQLIFFMMFFWTLIVPFALFVWNVVEVLRVKVDGTGNPMG
jgi:TM2 domain-containing membrane protein YozV